MIGSLISFFAGSGYFFAAGYLFCVFRGRSKHLMARLALALLWPIFVFLIIRELQARKIRDATSTEQLATPEKPSRSGKSSGKGKIVSNK